MRLEVSYRAARRSHSVRSAVTGSIVVERRESSSNKNMGIVTWHTEGFNQRDLRVIDFKRTNLINKRVADA